MLTSSSALPSRQLTSTLPSSSQHSQTHSGSNPLSIRLYKVLAANFDDEATKDALNTLSELYSTPNTEHVALNGKQKGKETRIDESDEDGEEEDDDEEAKVEMKRLSRVTSSIAEIIPGEIAARARKNLKRDVEAKLAESSRKFLDAFAEVNKQLDTLQEHIGAMRTRVGQAQAHLHQTNEACRSLLDRAGSLREQRQEVATRQSIVTLFLDRFTLSQDEVEAITSREVPVGKQFFAAMNKAESIQLDCRILMSGETGSTKAGLDILTATSAYLEQAYDKIFRWCSFEFRQMGKDATLEVGLSMREAVRRLQQRSELLTEALSYLTHTRQTTLLTGFTNALTRGGPGGLPRPIELHAHDPMRYVGDMLAWVHQAIAAEREFLEALFDVKGDRRMVGSVRTFKKSEEEEWMGGLMDAAVGKLCTPLKVRVQQTVRSQESSITLYKIANLLQFYSLTMQRTIGEETAISKALKDMTDMAYHVFYEAIQTQGRALLHARLDLDDTGVSPPLHVLDHAQVLREIMIVYQSSLADDDTAEVQSEGFKDILERMVDPAIEMCMTSSEEKQKLKPSWDRSVFVLNTLSYVQSVLEPFSFTSEKQGLLQGLVETRVMHLTEEHYANVIVDTGLGEIIEAWKTQQGNEPLSRLPNASTPRLQAALHKFSLWLTGMTVDRSPRLTQLTVQSLATRIHQAALERLIHTYRWFCEEVRKPENKYEAAATLLGSERPFGQVHLLWQIFGIEEKEEGDEEEGNEEEEEEADRESEDNDADDGRGGEGDDDGDDEEGESEGGSSY